MSTQTQPGAQTQEVVKEPSMLKQKEMIADNYEKLTSATERGQKVSATYVPGNLNELVMCFDMLNNLPEINAIQNGMRKKSGGLIMDAEKMGHSEDVCTYVKADIGNMAKGSIAPNGKPMPVSDLLLLSYTGCFTFMKWFELLRDQYGCRTVMLQVPYEGDGHTTDNMRDYVVKQLKEEVIPTFEEVSGVKFDIDRLREILKKSAQAEIDVINMVSRQITAANILKGIHMSMATRLVKLLRAIKVKEGDVLMTGGLALDTGLLAVLNESMVEQKVAVDIHNHPDSIYAGAIGDAIWGAFRHEKLARLGQLAMAS